MTNRKKRTVYTQFQWQKILQDYVASNTSAERFCRQRDIGYSTFKRWQQKLKGQSPAKASFYELRRVEDEIEPSIYPMSIALKNGVTLHVQNHADMAKVAQLIKQYTGQ